MLIKTLSQIFSKPAEAEVVLPVAPPPKKFGEERDALVLQCMGMGDSLFAIPVIKKMRDMLPNKAFDIFTYHPELFRRCPYVDKTYSMDDPALNDYSTVRRLFELDKLPHWDFDTMDFISILAGAGQLSFREKQLEYFPQEDDNATSYDVVLNTSETWPTRTWRLENWQRLADMLLAKGLSVAVVGKDLAPSGHDSMAKLSSPLAGCDNLVNQLTLDQTYFTIRKCKLFVTCQNGLSVLAGATDTETVVLGMSIDWSKRATYRHEDPHYKMTYVKGGCSMLCGSTGNYCPHPEFSPNEDFKCIPLYDAVEAAVLGKVAQRH